MRNNFCSVHKFYLHVHMISDACDQFHSHAQDFWHLIPKIKKCWKCTKHTTYTRYTVVVPVSESLNCLNHNHLSTSNRTYSFNISVLCLDQLHCCPPHSLIAVLSSERAAVVVVFSLLPLSDCVTQHF